MCGGRRETIALEMGLVCSERHVFHQPVTRRILSRVSAARYAQFLRGIVLPMAPAAP
jgi:hypothetical protein